MITVYVVQSSYYDDWSRDSMWLRKEDAERRLSILQEGRHFDRRWWQKYGEVAEEAVFESWEEGKKE